jgi:hypothetical protein
MADKKDSDNVFVAAGNMLALFIFVPVFAVIIIAGFFQLIAPAIPFLLIAAVIAGVAFAVHKYKTSPFTIRRDHESEVLDLLGRAEQQQRALPRQIGEALSKSIAGHKGLASWSLPASMLEPAQAFYAEEFLRTLPPMPGVPLEAERVYDLDYDRRTLKKGEDPPHRIRTDRHGRPTTLDMENFKAFLHRYVASTVDPKSTVTTFAATYADFLAELYGSVPEGDADASAFTVPLIDFVPNPKAVIHRALGAFWKPGIRDKHHFSTVREAFERNRKRASESVLRERDLAEGKVVNPDKFPGTPREVLEAYLSDSPLLPLFLAHVPFALPIAKRFEGHWIVARQGSGKTNALECLIHADLTEVIAGRASLLVMDSQGIASDTLLGRLSTLKLFGKGEPLDGKLIYLEPDLEFPLALNLFDIGLTDMGRLTASQREDMVSSACEVVEFMFTSLLGGDLSDNMTMLYKYLVPAMLVIPDADMNTFIDLLDTESGKDRSVPPGFQKYREHFSRLEPEVRSFLETDFLRDSELVKTKAAVRRRLRAAMADATFRRMFMQPRNKLNLFKELQSAKVILVNTYPAKTYVEQFGRLILALLMQATRQRLEIDRTHRMPTFVYIDECQDYIAKEERIAKYIDKCRKQNVGLIFAHQRLSNIENARVLNALSGVSIKFVGVSDADPAELASFVGSSADHIRSLPRGTFAAYVSGITQQAIDLKFPLSPFEHAPRMSRQQWDTMRREMRDRYAVRYEARSDAPAPSVVAPPVPSTGPSAPYQIDRPNRRTPTASQPTLPLGRSESQTPAPSERLRRPPDRPSEPPAGPEPDDYDPLK